MRGSGRRAIVAGRVLILSAGALLALRPSPVAAQQPGTYTESTTTTVAVRSGDQEHARTIARSGTYRVTLRGDTLVVQATALDLATTTGDETVRHDTDGFVGGHWKLLARGDAWRVVAEPFVPAALAEIVDLAGLMGDYFPPAPPLALSVGLTAPGGDGRTWERLPGDGVVARLAWTRQRDIDTVRTMADSLGVAVHERVTERGEGSWTDGGVVGWSRRVTTTSDSRVAGRVISARVAEVVRVERVP